MPLNNAALVVMANALSGVAGYAAIHTANPGSTGTNQSTAGRQAIVLAVDANGDITLTGDENFTGGASGGPATYVGLWSASSGGTFYGGFALTGDQTFNAAGEYVLEDIILDGSST